MSQSSGGSDLDTRIERCVNSLFAKWLKELWVETRARDPSGKRHFIFKRALESMIACPDILASAQETERLPYIGPFISKRLGKRLAEHISSGGEWSAVSDAILESNLPDRNTQFQPNAQDPPTEVIVSTQSQSQRKPREYIPAHRSTAYAILLALYVEKNSFNSKNHCTRADLIELGQPFSQTTMDENGDSKMRTAVKTLVEKEKIIKWGSPSRYALTDTGLVLAFHLWTVGEGREALSQAAPNNNDDNETNRAEDILETIISELSINPDNQQFGSVKRHSWECQSFFIKLLVDVREIRSREDRSQIIAKLSDSGIEVESRNLELGDFLWVAKKRAEFFSGSYEDSEEVVLDWIVERKREDDLASSIIDGRYKEQKFRLGQSGISNKIYLVESSQTADLRALSEDKFYSAIISTQVNDAMHLRYTGGFEESIRFLVHLTRMLQNQYSKDDLKFITAEYPIDRANLFSRMRPADGNVGPIYHMSYGTFAQLNSKSSNMKMRDLFARQLTCIRQVSSEKAKQIAMRWGTPRALWEMYRSIPLDQCEKRERVFEDWCSTNGEGRRYGRILSKRIHDLFCETSAYYN